MDGAKEKIVKAIGSIIAKGDSNKTRFSCAKESAGHAGMAGMPSGIGGNSPGRPRGRPDSLSRNSFWGMELPRGGIICLVFGGLATLPGVTVTGAPVFGEVMEVRQPDASLIEVRIWGDEFYGVTETLDGYTVVRDPDTRFLCYAQLSADGNDLRSTGVRATLAPPAALSTTPHIRIHPEAARAKALAARVKFSSKRRQPEGTTDSKNTTGRRYGVVLIVEFPDESHTIPPSEVRDYCNLTNYSGFGNNGSVRDYYYDVSLHQLTFTNFVPGTYYIAQHNKSYYTDPAVDWGERGRELTLEALDALDAGGFDFSTCDANSDGAVDAVTLFYVGTHNNNWSEGLFPGTAYDLSWSADGVDVDTCFWAPMGPALVLLTFCHETGHMLMDWPDLYDYDHDSAGVGKFCLMCHGASAFNPVQPCAYLKAMAGWITPVLLTMPQTALPVPSGGHATYKYLNPTNSQEYYLIENRQQTGRDSSVPDDGLAIWHVEMERGNNSYEMMTPEFHYLVTLVQADGLWDLEHDRNQGDSTDLWSDPQYREFSPLTALYPSWWDETRSGLSVVDISSSGPSMWFSFQPGVWVDFDDPFPLFHDGSFYFPFSTLVAGVEHVDPGGTVMIKAGLSPETATITKPLTMRSYEGPIRIGD